jgi:hypothetical protein
MTVPGIQRAGAKMCSVAKFDLCSCLISANSSLCSATCLLELYSLIANRVPFLISALEVATVSFFLRMAAFSCSLVLEMLLGRWSFGTKTRKNLSALLPCLPLVLLVGALAPDISYALLFGPDFGSIMVTMSSSMTGPLCFATVTPPSSTQFPSVPPLPESTLTAPHPPALDLVREVPRLLLLWQSLRLTFRRI